MTLDNIINNISQSQSPHDKGALFETLCLYFLRHDKFYMSRFDNLWLWKDWPGNHNKHDTGIDIIAKLRDSDSYCAIQCKFRDDSGCVTKSEIDSFLSASSKVIYSERIIISTIELGRNALDALEGQAIPVTLLTLERLEHSGINWDSFSFDNLDEVQYIHKTLLEHQEQAVTQVIEKFHSHSRGKLIMACGTGKTFTSLKIAQRLAGRGGLVIVLVPSISLLNQSILAWNSDRDEDINMHSFAVCFDKTVGRKDYPDEDLKISPLSFRNCLIFAEYSELQKSDRDSYSSDTAQERTQLDVYGQYPSSAAGNG